MATIMVVDDEEGVRDFLDDVFTRRGYNVCSYSNASEAMSAIKGGRSYDLLILDHCLRGDGVTTIDIENNGVAVSKVSRELNPDVLIFGMSGFDEKDMPKGEFRFNRHIKKPFDLISLMEDVSSCLR